MQPPSTIKAPVGADPVGDRLAAITTSVSPGGWAPTLHAIGILFLSLLLTSGATAETVVMDDRGGAVRVTPAARRIASLAPHATELLFAAGAGGQVIGAVDYSDYPPEAKTVPRLGSYAQVDLERVVASRPDLIVGWESGNGPVLERLRGMGFRVYVTEPRRFEDIPRTIEQLGQLAGTEAKARTVAADLRSRFTRLQNAYGTRPPVTVFYQVWHRPLMTVGGPHLLSRMIETCGGRNVFDSLNTLAPNVTAEAVLTADPDAIVASGMGEERPDWLDNWRRWPKLTAVKRGHLFFIPPDLLQRPTPRLLDGAERLCTALEQVRKNPGRSP